MQFRNFLIEVLRSEVDIVMPDAAPASSPILDFATFGADCLLRVASCCRNSDKKQRTTSAIEDASTSFLELSARPSVPIWNLSICTLFVRSDAGMMD